MAVKAGALTVPDRVTDFGGLTALAGTKLETMERIIDSTSTFIENYLGYTVKKTTYTSQEYSTEDGQMLNLDNFPVSSTATFTLQRRNSALDNDEWETIDTQYYHIDFPSGIIHAAGGWKFSRTRNGFRVTYTAGYDFNNTSTFLSETDGGDLELAMWQLCLVIYNRRGSSMGVKSERIGDYSVSYDSVLMENEDIKSILDKYAIQDVLGVLTPLQI